MPSPLKFTNATVQATLTLKDYDGGATMHITELISKKAEMYDHKDPDKLRFRSESADDVWKTKDGRVLRTMQMSNRHLFNAINYLARNGGRRSKKLEEELHKRIKQHRDVTGHIYAVKIPENEPKLRNIIRIPECQTEAT